MGCLLQGTDPIREDDLSTPQRPCLIPSQWALEYQPMNLGLGMGVGTNFQATASLGVEPEMETLVQVSHWGRTL